MSSQTTTTQGEGGISEHAVNEPRAQVRTLEATTQSGRQGGGGAAGRARRRLGIRTVGVSHEHVHSALERLGGDEVAQKPQAHHLVDVPRLAPHGLVGPEVGAWGLGVDPRAAGEQQRAEVFPSTGGLVVRGEVAGAPGALEALAGALVVSEGDEVVEAQRLEHPREV